MAKRFLHSPFELALQDEGWHVDVPALPRGKQGTGRWRDTTSDDSQDSSVDTYSHRSTYDNPAAAENDDSDTRDTETHHYDATAACDNSASNSTSFHSHACDRQTSDSSAANYRSTHTGA